MQFSQSWETAKVETEISLDPYNDAEIINGSSSTLSTVSLNLGLRGINVTFSSNKLF